MIEEYFLVTGSEVQTIDVFANLFLNYTEEQQVQ